MGIKTISPFERLNSTDRSIAGKRYDSSEVVGYWRYDFFSSSPNIPKADKPREFEDRAFNSRQATNLSLNKIARIQKYV